MKTKIRAIRWRQSDEIGGLQAALAVAAFEISWLEAQHAQASEAIAIGVATDGSLAVFTD
jgi:hypothetical protein